MKQYQDLIRELIEKYDQTKTISGDRTGVGTVKVVGRHLRFNLADGFPQLTLKKTVWKSMVAELLWFLTGNTDNDILETMGCKFWRPWCLKPGDVEFGDNLDNRRLVYVEPVTFINDGYHNPDTSGVSSPNGEVDDLLRSQWLKMMDRCYNHRAHNFRWYGGSGIFVCKRWHTLKNFIEDVKLLPNWKHKLDNWNNYQLDKDYYSSNCYHPDVCMWLSVEENSRYTSQSITIAVAPNGDSLIFPSIVAAAKTLGLSESSARRFAHGYSATFRGKNKLFKDWTFIITEEPFRHWVPKVGDLGPIYSSTWTNFGAGHVKSKSVNDLAKEFGRSSFQFGLSVIDLYKNREINGINQIQNAVDLLKNNPNSRRIIVNAWDPRHIPEDFWPDGSKKTPQENVIEGRASLAYCHAFFQFVTEELTREDRVCLIKHRLLQKLKEGEHLDENDEYWEKVMNTEVSIPTHRLNCLVTIRSSDTALGLPVNIASYALLLHMFAQVTNMTPGELIINTGDSHLYANQIEPMRAILEREPLPLPTLRLNPEVKDIFQFKMEDISLDGYEYHPEIRMDVAV